MSLPDFEAWAVFAIVNERKSFSGAAAALGISKSTVSKAISRLERRLGVTLFYRTSRRLSLTDSGFALAERARVMLAEAVEAEECAREEAATPSGTVRLAVPMSFGLTHVGPVIADFMSHYRDVQVDLHLSDARVDLVGDGFDVALRIGMLPDSSLRVRTLRPVAMGLFAAPAYLARKGTPRHPGELEPHDLFCYSYRDGEEGIRLHNGREEAFVRLDGRLRANNADVMLPAVMAGHGLLMLPDFIGVEARRSGAIVPVLPDWTPAPVAMHLVTPPGRLRPRRVDALIDTLAEAFDARGG